MAVTKHSTIRNMETKACRWHVSFAGLEDSDQPSVTSECEAVFVLDKPLDKTFCDRPQMSTKAHATHRATAVHS